jgi:hypothetical protein
VGKVDIVLMCHNKRHYYVRYIPNENDPATWDRKTLELLIRFFKPELKSVVSQLQQLAFTYDDLSQIHLKALDCDLLFRHAFPFLATERVFFPSQPHSINVLVGVLLCHTLALNHIDFQLDDNVPWLRKPLDALIDDPNQAICYSLATLYRGVLQLINHPYGSSILSDIIPISLFVLERMHEDYVERYSQDVLGDPSLGLRKYQEIKKSRLMGSGYWEITIRAAFTSHGERLPSFMEEIARKLRILRQLVDEAADAREDICAGLITYPFLILLSNPKYASRALKLIKRLWSYSPKIVLADTFHEVQDLHRLLVLSGAFLRLHQEIDKLWKDLNQLIETDIPRNNAWTFLSLIDLKRAAIDRIRLNNWKDIPLEHNIEMIIESQWKNSNRSGASYS